MTSPPGRLCGNWWDAADEPTDSRVLASATSLGVGSRGLRSGGRPRGSHVRHQGQAAIRRASAPATRSAIVGMVDHWTRLLHPVLLHTELPPWESSDAHMDPTGAGPRGTSPLYKRHLELGILSQERSLAQLCVFHSL